GDGEWIRRSGRVAESGIRDVVDGLFDAGARKVGPCGGKAVRGGEFDLGGVAGESRFRGESVRSIQYDLIDVERFVGVERDVYAERALGREEVLTGRAVVDGGLHSDAMGEDEAVVELNAFDAEL